MGIQELGEAFFTELLLNQKINDKTTFGEVLSNRRHLVLVPIYDVWTDRDEDKNRIKWIGCIKAVVPLFF